MIIKENGKRYYVDKEGKKCPIGCNTKQARKSLPSSLYINSAVVVSQVGVAFILTLSIFGFFFG